MSGDFQSAGGFDWKRLRESIRENDAGAYATGDAAGPMKLPELLDTMRRADWLVYEEDGRVYARPPCQPPNPMKSALKRHEGLLRILLKEESELTDADRRLICDHDPRMGFTPPGDWQGAAAVLRERGGMI